MNIQPTAIVRVHLESLDFLNTQDINNSTVLHLLNVLEESPYECERDHNQNVIPAYIDTSKLEQILKLSSLSLEDFSQSLRSCNFRPHLILENIKICCLYGKQRVEAAKLFLPSHKFWWTIKLYCLNSRSINNQIQKCSS